MSHKKTTHIIRPSFSSKRERGAALVVAIFIITVMAILAAIIARVLSISAAASVDEVYGTRALQAANSGVQVFTVDLIDAIEAESGNPTQACSNGLSDQTFQSPGLQNCTSNVSCTTTNYSEFGLTQFQITSVGQCTSANQQYSRVISVEVVDGHF
ncbi:MAG: hypothetical protein JJU03_04830 [Idiomarina sp.]|nr:hypothetical protein [Idiomarina sp.]